MNYLNQNNAWDGLGSVTNIYELKQDGPNAGKFESLIGAKDKIVFILLALSRKRILFPYPYTPNNSDPICRADDFENPSGGKRPLPGPCSKCQNAEWGVKASTGEPIPPDRKSVV